MYGQPSVLETGVRSDPTRGALADGVSDRLVNAIRDMAWPKTRYVTMNNDPVSAGALQRSSGIIIAEPASPSPPQGLRKAPIEHLRPNPRNPRKSFPEEDLEELAASIRARGVIQPILVRMSAGGTQGYEIIAGERRWRAAQRAGQHEVPDCSCRGK